METSINKQVNSKENSVVKLVLRYNIKGKPKARKNLTLFFRVINWEELSVSDFSSLFITHWLSHLTGIQSSDCKWKYMKFKDIKRKEYSIYPLDLSGKLNKYVANERLKFQFQLSCNSNLYLLILHYTPRELGSFEEYIPEVHTPSEEPYEFYYKLRKIEKGFVNPFSLQGKNCELIFVKRLGRGKGKNISYKEVEFATADAIFSSSVRHSKQKINT